MNAIKNRITKAAVVTGIIAGLLYGSWALYANYTDGIILASQAAAVQFICSALLGFFMTFIMDQICASKRTPRFIMIPASVITPLLLTLFVSYYSHYLNDTPNIIITILPSQILGLIWTSLYTAKLLKVTANTAPTTA